MRGRFLDRKKSDFTIPLGHQLDDALIELIRVEVAALDVKLPVLGDFLLAVSTDEMLL